MQISFLCVVLLGLLAPGQGKLTEWPMELHKLVSPQHQQQQGSSINGGLGEPETVPVVDPPYHAAGYMQLNNTYSGELFYFFFQERNKDPNAPLIFWTNGGPGCSSMFGLFTENGPYVIQEDLTLTWREFGWDIGHNMLYVDQPIGTGFSKSGDDRDFAEYEDTVGQDILIFLLEFFDLHPELKGKDLYISGESYAGKYLPAIANAIYDSNQKGKFMHLNLKGIILGNPDTSPIHIKFSYPDFAELNGLVTAEDAAWMRSHKWYCRYLYDICNQSKTRNDCVRANNYCYKYLYKPVKRLNPGMNVYDIRKKCVGPLCYDNSLLYKFLNAPEVQEKLGVRKDWVECASKVYRHMAGDKMITMEPTAVKLLNAGIRLIVYVGDQDFICNWVGNKAWLDSMEWAESDSWTGVLGKWRVQTEGRGLEEAGECETVEPLTFCKVYGAGHMVPMDKPEHAYRMVQTFIAEESFVSPEPTEALELPQGADKWSLAATK